MKREILIIMVGLFAFVALASLALAAETPTVCCEKTRPNDQNGVLFCQNVPQDQCDPSAKQVPTSCESTSFCRPGVCYNSREGTCLDNTPQGVCTANGGTWSEEEPPQCSLGCCILGDQAAFVSLVRCKKLSSALGLITNYKQDIASEVQCVLTVQNQERGACVYEKEFEKTCKLTTRAECTSGNINGTKAAGEFFPGKLCTAEELGTPCSPTSQKSCIPGKDEIYFIDSCGNPANIYDSSKLNDRNYWSDIMSKTESCNPNGNNANSQSCGNCNYLQGSYCREVGRDSAPICADLNCENTINGKSYKHGESWCVYNDEGRNNVGNNNAGSRFYKHICVNGQEIVEQCADFRQEECIEGAIEIPGGTFSQAACRVNRWQDCTAQADKLDCENTDRRDCIWKEGVSSSGSAAGICIPKNSPGLKFWEGEETREICAQANSACMVKFEKTLLGSEECKENCHCLTETWRRQRAEVCLALGDCGPKINWIGERGYKDGFNISQTKA